MVRKFGPFDGGTIGKELRALPTDDYMSLTDAMDAFQRDAGGRIRHQDYGDGLFMLKTSGNGQGRLLYGEIGEVHGVSVYVLVAVLVYKKESQEAPDQLVKTARKRLADYKKEIA